MRRHNYYKPEWTGTKWVRFDGGVCAVFAPPVPACYVVYLDGVVSYVGQTTNLRKRLANHGIIFSRYSESIDTPWGQFDRVSIKAKFCERFGDWAMLELRLLKRLQPKFNCVGSTKKRRSVKERGE